MSFLWAYKHTPVSCCEHACFKCRFPNTSLPQCLEKFCFVLNCFCSTSRLSCITLQFCRSIVYLQMTRVNGHFENNCKDFFFYPNMVKINKKEKSVYYFDPILFSDNRASRRKEAIIGMSEVSLGEWSKIWSRHILIEGYKQNLGQNKSSPVCRISLWLLRGYSEVGGHCVQRDALFQKFTWNLNLWITAVLK